jgi:cob(I)alamin adenosyltransferase
MTKLYTRKGDEGCSRVMEGDMIPKYSAIFRVLGDLDELNCLLSSFSRTMEASGELVQFSRMREIQRNCMRICSSINLGEQYPFSSTETVKNLEDWIDQMTASTPLLTCFIYPDHELHYARAVCRRVERSISKYLLKDCKNHPYDKDILSYMNRLSDYLFALARYCNHKACRTEEKFVF